MDNEALVGWKACHNAGLRNTASKMPWFLMHHELKQYYKDKNGNLIRFKSSESAKKRASILNGW